MFEQRLFVDAGGLMSYEMRSPDQTRRSAAQLDKILRGESPAQIPFELPTQSEFVINQRTARALGLTLPRSLLVRATDVVE